VGHPTMARYSGGGGSVRTKKGGQIPSSAKMHDNAVITGRRAGVIGLQLPVLTNVRIKGGKPFRTEVGGRNLLKTSFFVDKIVRLSDRNPMK